MENSLNLTSRFCLLPSEIIQQILLNLALPEIVGIKSLNKSISDLVCDQVFVRDFNSKSKSTNWLFVYKKRWPRDSLLHGFSDQSDRWFKLQIADLLKPIIFPGESVYFLAASGNFFMFSCNTLKEVVAVNLANKTVKRLPPSPLGPRGISSWRRSGMKLVSGSGHFRFLFAELVDTRPILFVYTSETDTWMSVKGKECLDGAPSGNERVGDYIYLNVVNGPYESVIMIVGLESTTDEPIVVRFRFEDGRNDGHRLYVYGDGYMMVIKSKGVDDPEKGAKVLKEVEVWGLGLSGRKWELNSMVPSEIMEKIKRPYRVIMGCLDKRGGVIRAALLSNFEGLWDIIWLCYDVEKSNWTWVPLPGFKMSGLNMAGIAFSSGLTL